MNDKYQFANVYELMLAVMYTRNDLEHIRLQYSSM